MNAFKKLSIFIFALGVVLTTATNLRGGRIVGPGEVLLIMSLVFSLVWLGITKQYVINGGIKLFLSYWGVCLFLLLLGIASSLILRYFDWEHAGHDLQSYLFLFGILVIVYPIFLNSLKDVHYLVKQFLNIQLVLLVYFTLFFFGFTRILGEYVSYNGVRFFGFSSNPNQLAMALAILPYLCLYYFSRTQSKLMKGKLIVVLILSVFLGLETASDALIMGWLASFSFGLLLYIMRLKNQNGFIITLKYFFVPTILSLNLYLLFDRLVLNAMEVYDKQSQGADRLYRWSEALGTIEKSPFFGFGPGNYMYESFWNSQIGEAHNTVLDWGMSTGIIGILVYFILLFFIFRHLVATKKYLLLSGLITLVVYSLFHFVMRHPYYWLNLYLLLVLSEDKNFVVLNVPALKKSKLFPRVQRNY